MKPDLKFVLAVLLLAVPCICGAQTTKVRGRVTDESGAGIPFAAVWFKDSQVGITTDIDGWYSLESKDMSHTVLAAHLMGYTGSEATVVPGQFNNVYFTLRLADNRLQGAKVKADNRKARELLANIQKNRARNDPDAHPEYVCTIYNKMELDLTHPAEQLNSRGFRRNFGFVFDYIDTSSVSGVPYLPVMMSETIAERSHSSNPDRDYEKVLGNRLSGLNPDGNNMLGQFTGSLHLRVNFYRPFINAFDVQFPSPIQEGGLMFYNYYIIDTLMVDARKTLLVRYHPKPLVSTPAFDGEMRIDAEDFALRSIHANMRNTTNVNWLRDLVLDAEYARQPDSTWFYKKDRLYADLSMSLRDSSTMLSFIGTRELDWSDVRFALDSPVPAALVEIEDAASHRDDSFWEAARPAPLSNKEEQVYAMVERIKSVPVFKSFYDIVYTLVNGYAEFGKIGIGPYFKLVSYNISEGVRPQFGLRTSKDFSRTDRFTVYGAFGTRDLTPKGGASWEHLFGRIPERKLTLAAKYDVYQMGSGVNALTEGNMFATLFGGSNNTRLAMMSSASGVYSHEASPSLTFELGFDLRRYYATERDWVKPSLQVPMYAPDSSKISSVASNELFAALRFCKDETVNRGLFTRKHVYSEYPAVTLSLAGSVPGLRKGDFGYLRPELTLSWNPRIPPFGISKIWINAGKVFGTVPYPLLHLHEGNSTMLMDRFSFACMDYMEFASDAWITIFYNHCFNGFFLGKLPLIRRLGLREEFTFKAAWGSLSDANNGNAAKVAIADMKAPMLFPNGTSSLGHEPYIEFGAGISNILKFIRVDCYWRATHRDERIVLIETESELGQKVLGRLKTPNFAVKIGAEFKF